MSSNSNNQTGEREEGDTHTHTHTELEQRDRCRTLSSLSLSVWILPYSWVALWWMEGFLHFFSFLTLFFFLKSKLLDKLDTASLISHFLFFLLLSSSSSFFHFLTLPFFSFFVLHFSLSWSLALLPLFLFSVCLLLVHGFFFCLCKMTFPVWNVALLPVPYRHRSALWVFSTNWYLDTTVVHCGMISVHDRAVNPPLLSVRSVVSRVGIIWV